MKTTTLTQACNGVIFRGIPLLGAAVALAVSPVSMNLLSVKSALLQSGVAVLFAAWCVKTAGREPFRLDNHLAGIIIPAFLFP